MNSYKVSTIPVSEVAEMNRLIASLLGLGLVTGLAYSVLGTSPTEAAPPSTVQYQGRLTDSNGKPLEGVITKLTFKLYSSSTPSAATFVWGEAHNAVPVRRGVFTVLLGAGNETVDFAGAATAGASPLTSQILNGSDRYLQVQVNGDAPLTPTTLLGAVPFAIAAGGSVPVGGIIDWYRPTPTTPVPDGWAICDGSVINDSISILDTKATPNLVNKFTRGLDLSANPTYGYGLASGAVLPDAGGADSVNLSHNHGGWDHTHSGGSHTHGMAHTHGGSSLVVSGVQNRVILPSGNTHRTDFLAGGEAHTHSLSGNTDSSSTSSTGTASGQTGNPTSNMPNSLGTHDNRPTYVGLLKLIRTR